MTRLCRFFNIDSRVVGRSASIVIERVLRVATLLTEPTCPVRTRVVGCDITTPTAWRQFVVISSLRPTDRPTTRRHRFRFARCRSVALLTDTQAVLRSSVVPTATLAIRHACRWVAEHLSVSQSVSQYASGASVHCCINSPPGPRLAARARALATRDARTHATVTPVRTGEWPV